MFPRISKSNIILKFITILIIVNVYYVIMITNSLKVLNDKIISNFNFDPDSNSDYDSNFDSDSDSIDQDLDESVDIVYTWVNGSDPQFRVRMNQYVKSVSNHWSSKTLLETSENRFDNKDELKFSLRSIELYAPWIRHVFIVTNGQVPIWLNLSYEKVSIITHAQIFLNKSNLPTFSSPAIESALHRIPGLSKRFIYFNDDLLLGQPITLEDYITPNHEYLVYLELWYIADCARFCPWSHVANGYCNHLCYNSDCQFDGGDCDNEEVLKPGNNDLTKKPPYDASLQFVQRLYNSAFGFQIRRMQSHAPIMIDRSVMNEMQRKFAREFAATESNRLRTGNDMQYPFSYYHYLLEERKVLNASEIFEKFDSDYSNTWSAVEIEQIPFTENDKIIFNNILINCTSQSDTNSIDKELVLNCSPLTELLIENFGTQPKYKGKIVQNLRKIYSFFMLHSNIEETERDFNRVKRNPTKFICLNDDLDRNKPEVNKEIKKQMLDFYLFLYPNASKFELSTNN